MLKGADTDELAARGDSSASGHQTLLISYHGKTFCYRASDCIDGKPEEENSPNGSYRYTHKKYVCELFLITHIHIIRGERKAALPFSEGSAVGEGILGTTSLQVRGPHHQSEP